MRVKIFGFYKREHSHDDDPLDGFVVPYHTGQSTPWGERYTYDGNFYRRGEPSFMPDGELLIDEVSQPQLVAVETHTESNCSEIDFIERRQNVLEKIAAFFLELKKGK